MVIKKAYVYALITPIYVKSVVELVERLGKLLPLVIKHIVLLQMLYPSRDFGLYILKEALDFS